MKKIKYTTFIGIITEKKLGKGAKGKAPTKFRGYSPNQNMY
jgi:hypothetical protein